MLIILFVAAPISAFRVDITYETEFADANKTEENKRDDQMCWAAVAANMVAWHVSINKSSANAQRLFEWLVKNEKNRSPSQVHKGIQQLGWSSKLDWIGGDANNVELWIMGSLMKGRIVYIDVAEPLDTYAHSMTVYGLTIINKKEMYIEYVDSDDNKIKMYKSKLIKNDLGFFKFTDGEYKGESIIFFYSLGK
jgi:hypothetical protein